MALLLLLQLLTFLLPFANVHSFIQPSYRALRVPSFTVSSVADSSSITTPSTIEANSDNISPTTPTSQLGAWMPLGSASSLTGINPTQIRVCGLDIAVWHKPTSKKQKVATEWSALIDACPHRLAPLSQGRVDPMSGCIHCPYHGWSFDVDGSLIELPQLDEGRTMDIATGRNGAATSLPVHAAGDLLFVFLPTDVVGESWPIERLPEDHYPYLADKMANNATWYMRELPYSWDFLIENFMDPAHIPYAHHSLQGTRDDGSPINMEILAENFTHVEAGFIDICRGKQRDGVLSFQRPAFYHFRTRGNATAEYNPNLLIFTSPIEEGKCRVIMPDFKLGFFPTWIGHLGSNRFLNSDTWLHDAERNARMQTDTINKQRGPVAVGAAKGGKQPTEGLNYILASKSDLGPSLFRKWWSKHLENSPPNTYGPASPSSFSKSALSRAEQIDPWVHHTKHCIKCRTALKKMRILQKVVTALAASGAILLRTKPPIAIVAVLAGLYAHNFLRKFATAIEGNPNRAEIDDRSVAAIK